MTQQEIKELQEITYRLLFDADIERVPDPNKEENIPRIKAEEQKKQEDLKRFWAGPGNPLMEKWKKDIRIGVWDILMSKDDCNCSTSIKKRGIVSILKMLSEAETILTKE